VASSAHVPSSLAIKLGIKSGQTVCLLKATPQTAELIQRACPDQVTLVERLGRKRFDVILFWPRRLAGLAERFEQLQRHVVPTGAVWAVIPKQPVARSRGLTLVWSQVQEAALKTNLVDNKIVSLSAEEYATRFVIRTERRKDLRDF